MSPTQTTSATPGRTCYTTRPDSFESAGQLHWASVYIAREHRLNGEAYNGEWTCPCDECLHVRRELVRQANEKRRMAAAAGGGR